MILRDVLERELEYAIFKYSRTVSGPSIQAGKGKEVTIPAFKARSLQRRGLGDIIDLVKLDNRIWDSEKESGLDYDSETRLNRRGVHPKHVEIDKKALVLDIKSEVNLHNIGEYQLIDFDVLNNFPEGGDIRRLL